jgi:DnaJ-class molecular chaperone
MTNPLLCKPCRGSGFIGYLNPCPCCHGTGWAQFDMLTATVSFGLILVGSIFFAAAVYVLTN